MGKGSSRRPTNQQAFDENIQKIFSYVPPYLRGKTPVTEQPKPKEPSNDVPKL